MILNLTIALVLESGRQINFRKKCETLNKV